jgi:alpha-L-fucosidase 2
VTGLRARGGFEVDEQWADGKLLAATIRSTWGTAGRIRYGGKVADIALQPGATISVGGDLRTRLR